MTAELKINTIFPTRDSVEQAAQEAHAALPIETSNELHALLEIYRNSLLKEVERHEALRRSE